MAEAQENVMVKDATPKKVMALASRKYSRDEKIKKDEEELEQLIAENKGEVKAEAEEQEPEPTSAEEKTFKKRYGDLRRHAQQKESDLQEQINQLKEQLDSATKKQIELPKSDEDIEAWTKKYPDVAGIVETIAIKKSKEQAQELESRIQKINEMQESATKEKAEVELLKLHPDFVDIREDDDFHNWAEEQPQWVQKALYENDNDALSAARAIDLYKADRNIGKKKPSSKDAALATNPKSTRTKPQINEESTYLKESQVQKMSSQEYERRADEVMEAIRSGKFVYDVSGSAR
jgi:type II secretory pathway pseudopilin PulG